MRKRLLTSLLALVMCLGLTAPALADDPFVGTKDGITYKAVVTASMALNSYKAPDTLFGGMFDGNYSIIVVEKAASDIVTANITGAVAIWTSAFYFCNQLTSVTIPDTIRAIGSNAFYQCSKLPVLTIPASVEFIDYGIAHGCPSMTKIEVAEDNAYYCSVDGVLFSKDMTELLAYPAGKTDAAYTVPDSVVDIYPYAFSGCTNLSSLTIPASVTKSGEDMISNCGSITVYGEAGSYAQTYAEKNNITFVIGKEPDPVDPADPVDPTDPIVPVDPADPIDPNPPVDPADPVDPVDPADPVVPVDPIVPTPPVTPVYPTYPNHPVSPSNPSKPEDTGSEPETPAGKPSETETAGQPEIPVLPERPSIPAPVYADVAPGVWYSEAAAYVASRGLMTGTSANNFSPDAQMTRAMVWTVLGRLAGADVNGTGAGWYEKAQAWAAAAGISDGANPEGSITREELVTMLYRHAGSPAAAMELNGFTDGEAVSDWAMPAVRWAAANQILTGDNGTLNPASPASRAEVAAILMRFCENILE